MAPLRIGIVGTGGIGRTHVDAYARAGHPVTAVADVDTAKAAKAAAEIGATHCPDLPSLLAQVDAVSVCTPPAAHRPTVLAAIEAGVAVLCEKPLAITVADCHAVVDAARGATAPVAVGFCHRLQPEIMTMKAALERGDIGTPLALYNRFSGPLDGVENTWFADPAVSGGGTVMDTSVHSIDLFRYLFGDVTQVRALGTTTATDRGPALRVEDTSTLIVQSATGVLGTLEASWRTVPGVAEVVVRGTQGTLRFDYLTGALTLAAADGMVTEIPAEGDDRFLAQAKAFVASVTDGATPPAVPADGLAAAQVIAQAYASVSGA